MAQRNQSLVLDIGANIGGLKTQMQAARSALLEFQKGAISAADAVDQSFRDLGADGLAASAKRAEQQFDRMFKSIAANAKAISAETDQAFALQLFDAGAADEQVRKLTQQAGQLRAMAASFEVASKEGGEFSARQQQLAISAQTAALGLEKEARELDELAGAYRSGIAQIGAADTATGRSTQASAQKREGLRQLGYQLNDFSTQVAAGTSPAQAFAQQISQATQAVQLMSGGTSKLATFLGGPWGIALAVALPLVASFAAKLFEGGDAAEKAADKLKKNAQETEAAGQAEEAFSRTLEGRIKLQRELTEEIDRTTKSQRALTRETAAQRQRDLESAQGEASELRRQVEQQRARVDRARGRFEGRIRPAAGETQQATLAQVKAEEAKLAELQNKLIGAQAQIPTLESAARAAKIPILGDQVDAKLDAATDATHRYTDAIDELNRKLAAGGISEDEYLFKAEALARTRDAAIETARAADRKSSGGSGSRETAQFGHPVPGARLSSGFGPRKAPIKGASTNHLGLDYAAPLGTPVLAAMDGFVKFADKVAGYGNQIELGHGAGTASRYSHLDGFNVREGQEVRKGDVIGYVGSTGTSTNPHLHYEVLVNGKKVDPSKGRFAVDATQVAKQGDKDDDRAAREAEQAERREAAFADASADAEGRILAAKLALVTDAGERADLAKDQLRIESDSYVASLDEKVRRGDLTQAQRDKLAIDDAIALVLLEQKIDLDEQQRLLGEQLDLDRAEIDAKSSLLQLQGDLATTAEERRRINRQLLELDLQERRDRANRKLQSTDQATRAEGQRDLDRVNAEAPLLRQRNERDNADPVQRYLDGLRQSADDTEEALLGVQARGLQALEDGLAGVLDGTESVGSAFKKMANQIIADLARIAVQKAVLGAVGGLFGGGGFLGGLFGGGGGSALPPLYAEGGMITGPGTGTSDSILARVSNGEFVVNAAATGRYLPLLKAINDNQLPAFATGGLVGTAPSFRAPSLGPRGGASAERVQVDVRARVEAGPMLDARIEEVSARTVGSAAEPIIAAAEARTRRGLSRPRLPGGRG